MATENIVLTILSLVAFGGVAALVGYLRIAKSSYTDPDFDSSPSPPLTVTPIRDLPASGRTACAGVVRLIEGRRAPTTLGGTPAVWVEVFIETGEIDSHSRQIVRRRPVLAYVDAVPFWMEDDTGERVGVLPNGGHLGSGASTRPLSLADDATARWLQELLVANNKAIDSNAPLLYAEVAIIPGDTVVVHGAVRREESGGAPCRGAANGSVVICADAEGLSVWRGTG